MTEKPTILIIDDEPITLDILAGHLKKENYEFAFATSGFEALALLEKVTPDVILLDVMMPDLDGFEVCQRLKADKRWQHIPIILVTALGGKEDLARGLEAGADDFVNKPVSTVELRARVRSMLRIKKQYDALQATLQLRDDLAHMIVHDMRTPLSVIAGYCDWLLMKDTIPPKDLEDIKKIKFQTNYLNEFLNDLLILAKMEADRLVLNRLMVDVNYLVQQVVQDQNIIAQSKNIELVVDLPAKPQQVSLDVNLFSRVLDNLISNAQKFSPNDSTVTVQVEYPRTTSASSLSEPSLRITVTDEGAGIAEEYRERIFDKFEIVTIREANISHIGLGLAFCKMVIEAHNGHITVTDNDPAGSVFTVEI